MAVAKGRIALFPRARWSKAHSKPVFRRFAHSVMPGLPLVAGVIDQSPIIFGEGASIAMRKGQPELKKSLNDAIAAIRADGRYKKIADKYFDFDPYGKD